jgi:hypothetical protein
MKHIQLLSLLLLLVCMSLLIIPVAAQGDLEVYVTTQDYVVLRLGPGVNWERLTVLDYGVTLQATGRTVNSDWIQVAYDVPLPPETNPDATINGITYGWVSRNYLIHSGNVLNLPVDGVQTFTTARRSGSRIGLPRGATYYSGDNYFFEVVGVFEHSQSAEVTGRIGSSANGYYWLQFRLNGEYYWIPNWVAGGGSDTVLDASYLFPYGRVFNATLVTRHEIGNKLYDMSSRWSDLSAGFAATCNNIPEPVVFRFSLANNVDIAREPVFTAPYNALTLARDNVNIAVSQFQAVCDRDPESRFATPEDIDIALAAIREAQLQLNVLDILLNPIGTRHPIANND